MQRVAFILIGILMLTVSFSGNPGQAGGGKSSPWKPFLSGEVFKELTNRSIQTIEQAARGGDKNAPARIETEAAILAGYTLSTAAATDDAVASLRAAAFQAAQAAHKKEIKSLGEFGKLTRNAPRALAEVKDWKTHLHDLDDLMYLFRNQAKGGEGVPVDLHYQPKLKNLNGIEALIGALATKKLNEANLDKVAKELPLLAYRVAVIGAITHELPNTKDAGKWRELALQMRDASIALAESAQKKNADGIMNAALSLEMSCTQCHSAFKK